MIPPKFLASIAFDVRVILMIVRTASTETAASSTTRPESAPRPDNGPREMPIFFIIGIAINAIMMLLFAAWFASEWKKQNKGRVGKKQK